MSILIRTWPASIVLLCITLGAAHAQEAVYYVDASAAGTGSGTLQDPYPTVRQAIDHANHDAASSLFASYRIDVGPGDYLNDGGQLLYDNMRLIGTAGAGRTRLVDGSLLLSSDGYVEGIHFAGSTIWAGYSKHYSSSLIRCIISDVPYAITLVSGVVDLAFVDVTRCGAVFRVMGPGNAYAVACVFWQNSVLQVGGLVSPFERDCLHEDPLCFSPQNFHRRRISPAIDFLPASIHYPLDPDGTRADVGALPYDAAQPLGRTVCWNEANSTGARGRIGLAGTVSAAGLASGDVLQLRVQRCPAHTAVLFLAGEATGSLPIGASTLCLDGSPTRLGLVQTDSTGFAALDAPLIGALAVPMAGSTRTLQAWHRDTTHDGYSLTSAAEVRFGP